MVKKKVFSQTPVPIYYDIPKKDDVLRGSESSARLPSDYSPPTLKVQGASEELFRTISFDVQMTVRSKVDFTRKQLCMLTGIALSDVVENGLGLSDWMILEWLYSNLLGNKQEYFQRKDQKEFELSLLLKIVLLGGTWMGLEEKVQLPEDIQTLVRASKFIPSGRTKASWRQHWDLWKFLEIRAVPLDVLLERSKTTERYSSYCKGYGESSRMGRRQKTRPSAELDGEPVEIDKEQAVKLDLHRLDQLLSAVLLEIKYTRKV
jgi:hypothetical protein